MFSEVIKAKLKEIVIKINDRSYQILNEINRNHRELVSNQFKLGSTIDSRPSNLGRRIIKTGWKSSRIINQIVLKPIKSDRNQLSKLIQIN